MPQYGAIITQVEQ